MVPSRWVRALRAVGLSLALGAWLLGGAAHAQGSSTPIRILVGFPPGGGTDAIARLLGEKMKDQLGGETVIVDNRAGAGGQIAAIALKNAPPDGHTFFISHDHTISILPLVTKNPGFDPAKDFVPVAGFATFVNALAVSGGTPARSMSEYISWVRQNGGKGNVGVPAPASVPEFLVKLIGQKYGLDLQAAPYRGSAPMMADMLGNQIGAGVGSIPDFIENHKAGKIRVVAVMGNQRQAAVPEAPTFAELGLAGFEDVPYYGFFAPAGTPQAAIDRFSGALQKVLAEPDVRQQLTSLGLTVGFMPQQQLAARERAYSATWARLIKNLGFQPQ
jgi:tripartite-type tricarboxylate transporter receptor subunit TctC